MKWWSIALCLFAACTALHAADAVWQPAPGYTQIPIWPGKVPDARPMPGPESITPNMAVSNVAQPTITVYSPKRANSGAAVVVFPGGGFQILAIALEGTDICNWLTSKGITCGLLKYRVPSAPYHWQCDCRPHNLEIPTQALEDAQRTMGLVRLHAKQWHIDPHKVGVIGFSAGGYLVAQISTHFKHRLYPAIDAADQQSARPDFAMAIYPGHLATESNALNPNVPVSHDTPTTFLVQAEDDHVDGVEQSLVYFTALKNADVPVEMHLYAQGGHAFGLRPSRLPISQWPALAEVWMWTIGVLSN